MRCTHSVWVTVTLIGLQFKQRLCKYVLLIVLETSSLMFLESCGVLGLSTGQSDVSRWHVSYSAIVLLT